MSTGILIAKNIISKGIKSYQDNKSLLLKLNINLFDIAAINGYYFILEFLKNDNFKINKN